MYSNILDYLTCPECKKSLDLNTKKQINDEVIEGIQNMLDEASKGIKEGVRVSKDKLINVGVVIKDDNPKIDLLNKLLTENNIDYDVKTATESKNI